MAALVARDQTSTTGRNLRYIEEQTSLDPMTTTIARLKLELNQPEPIPEDGQFMLEELTELLGLQQELHYSGGEEEEMEGLQELINSL